MHFTFKSHTVSMRLKQINTLSRRNNYFSHISGFLFEQSMGGRKLLLNSRNYLMNCHSENNSLCVSIISLSNTFQQNYGNSHNNMLSSLTGNVDSPLSTHIIVDPSSETDTDSCVEKKAKYAGTAKHKI